MGNFSLLIEEKLLHTNFVNPNRLVKGAIALANALAEKRSVKLVTLKEGTQWRMSLDHVLKLYVYNIIAKIGFLSTRIIVKFLMILVVEKM